MADEGDEPSTLVASIDQGATGLWQINTETGSTYVVDLVVQVRSDNLPTLRLTSHIVGIAKIRATGDRRPEC